MDILISSNVERLLAELSGHNGKAVADMMDTDKSFKAQIEEIEKLVLGK